MEYLENRVLVVIIFMADMVNTLAREVIHLLGADGSKPAALATLITFALSIPILLVSTLCYNVKAKTVYDKGCCNIFSMVTGLLFYYYGDNISYILDQYGEELGCGDLCQENSRVVALFSLGLALICYHILPAIIRKLAAEYEEEKRPLLDSMVVIPKMDAVFTAVLILAKTNVQCSTHDLIVYIGFFGTCIVIGWVTMVSHFMHSHNGCCGAIILSLLMINFPLYMLSDNTQPLNCIMIGMEVNTAAENITNHTQIVTTSLNGHLRIGFTSTTIFIISFVAIPFLCKSSTRRYIF